MRVIPIDELVRARCPVNLSAEVKERLEASYANYFERHPKLSKGQVQAFYDAERGGGAGQCTEVPFISFTEPGYRYLCSFGGPP